MKILHLIYDHINNPWIGGGGAVRIAEIYSRLAEKGHIISIVSGKYPDCRDYAENGFKICFVGNATNYAISTFSYAYYAKKEMNKQYRNFDVIIEDFAPWNPIFSYKVKDRPVILQLQNYSGKEIFKKYYLLGAPFYFIEKLYPRKFKFVTSLSNSILNHLNISGSVIPSGVHEVSDRLYDGNYIAFLGRLDIYQKGLDTLVDAAKASGLPVKIAGDGYNRPRFLRMIEGVRNIEWVGMLRGDAKNEFIKNSQFLVTPSRFEGQNIVVLEFAAMGKPSIVSDIDVLSYAEENGFAVKFKTADPKALAKQIGFLFNNQSVISRMGSQALQYAKNFTWDKVTEKYEGYLSGVIEKYNKTC